MVRIDTSDIPKHVAIIMDGNRRWAKARGLSPLRGHLEGEKRIEPIVDRAMELGISYLTFWAFSTENWKRTKREVQFLLNLYRRNLAKTVDRFHRKEVRVRVIGNLVKFPADIQEKTKEWIERTKDNDKITVNVALSYGGRDEMLRAITRLLRSREEHTLRFSGSSHLARSAQGDKVALGSLATLSNSTVTESELEQYLDTAGQPDPDLLIRTGGELRLSGFLSWQIAYTELYFTETFWPDFTVREFDKALAEYQRRQRRFGR